MPTSFENLLGNQLFLASGSTETATGKELFAGKKYVALYFSAHWCAPCKKFTPLLAGAYSKAKARDAGVFETVFISADQDVEDFDKYRRSQPWPALNPEDPLSDALRTEYGCDGFPSLTIVNAATGAVVTKDAVQDVAMDQEGLNAPWRPLTLKEILTDDFPLTTGSDSIHADATCLGDLRAKGIREVAFYFSAHWCPPCRQFTPKLAAVYKKLKESGRSDLEIIFVSSDQEAKEAASYNKGMGFPMLTFGNPKANLFKKCLGIRGIPTLVSMRLGATAADAPEIINPKGVAAIHSPTAEAFPWVPTPAPASVVFRPAREVFEFFEEPIAILDLRTVSDADAKTMTAALEAEVLAARAAKQPLPWQAMILPKEDAVKLAPGCCPQGCKLVPSGDRAPAGCDVCTTPVGETGHSCAVHDFDMCDGCVKAGKSPSAPGAGLFGQIMGHVKADVDLTAPWMYVVIGLATNPTVPKAAKVPTFDAAGIAAVVKECSFGEAVGDPSTCAA